MPRIIIACCCILLLLSACTFRLAVFADRTVKSSAASHLTSLPRYQALYHFSYPCDLSRSCSNSVGDIISELKSPLLTVRLAAVSEIGCHGAKGVAAAPMLRQLLDDPYPDIRSWAIFALWRLGAAADSEDKLLSMIDDPNRKVALTAARVLAEVGTPRGLEAARKASKWTALELLRGPSSLMLSPFVFLYVTARAVTIGYIETPISKETSPSSKDMSTWTKNLAATVWIPVGLIGGGIAGTAYACGYAIGGIADTLSGGAFALSPGSELPFEFVAFTGGEDWFREPKRFTRFAFPRCER